MPASHSAAPSGAAPHSAAPTADEVAAFQRATRDLIGIALRSLEVAGGELSLPQMRVLLALHDLGRVPSSAVAHELDLGASSVTRLADRLVASGHVRRGSDPRHRSVVTLELDVTGRVLVDRVLAWRDQELARILSQLPAALRATTTQGLSALHEAMDADYASTRHGPVPL